MRSGDLIGQILQAGLARGAGPRMQAGMQSQPGLGGLLGGLLGGSGTGSGGLGGMLGGGRQSSGGGLGGLASMADDYLRGGRGMPAGRAGGMSSGGLGGMGGLGGGMGGGLGGLIGSMLGGGRTSGALGGAAMGVIGMIAMNALRNWGQSSSASQAGASPAGASGAAPREPLTPEEMPAPDERTQQVMLTAMIAAAKSDGHVDDTEVNMIVGKLKEAGADAEASDWVLRELAKPLNVDALVAAVPNIEVGAQVYAASVLAITPDTPEEKTYLDMLATKLGLQPEVRAYIHRSLGTPMEG